MHGQQNLKLYTFSWYSCDNGKMTPLNILSGLILSSTYKQLQSQLPAPRETKQTTIYQETILTVLDM